MFQMFLTFREWKISVKNGNYCIKRRMMMKTDHGKGSAVQFQWISCACRGVTILENLGRPNLLYYYKLLLCCLVLNVLCHG